MRTFEVSDTELEKAQKWLETHECEASKKAIEVNKCVASPVSVISYIFTPTSIGYTTEIQCVCGEIYDICDYNW